MDPLSLVFGSLLGGGGGSSSTSSSQLTNTIGFNPVINIGGGVDGVGGNTTSEPVATTISDQTPKQAGAFGLPSGGFDSEFSANAGSFDLAGLPWLWIIGGGAALFFITSGKVKS
ncbi:MAG: hypothetical protein COB56_01075 [Robiginitomaculum sp.]|nr:MAG: hypothetical protein COB56_01075 [Robiginitomaculum sp.]